jgi:hypothetical protein
MGFGFVEMPDEQPEHGPNGGGRQGEPESGEPPGSAEDGNTSQRPKPRTGATDARVLAERRFELAVRRLAEASKRGEPLDAALRDLDSARAALAVDAQPIELVRLGSLIDGALDRAERRRTGDEIPVPLPWPALAEALGGGLWPGAHVIVSGTGVGKSQLSIQTALGAAKVGIPAVYVGLELEEVQIALRVVGEHMGKRWSNYYRGRCSADDIQKAREGAKDLAGLPFYPEFSDARGWPASRLAKLCERVRMDHPTGPLLVVLDYLQLVGDEPGAERRTDMRERISDAMMKARDVARRFDAAVLVISSTARTQYGLLASDVKEAGLATRTMPEHFARLRTILNPSVLIGLGKESGETEYCADSLTVLIRWPTLLASGEKAIIAANPKVRSMPETWCALAFDGGRFRELDVLSVDDLPPPPKRARKGRDGPADESATKDPGAEQDPHAAMVFEAVDKACEPYPNMTQLAHAVPINYDLARKTVASLLKSGQLVKSVKGIVRPAGSSQLELDDA